MNKIIKLLLTLAAASVFAYAQTADTAKQASQSQEVKAAGAVTTTAGKKYIANTLPTPKTNWSKVKDLFL